MSFLAKLFLDDKEITVLESSFSIDQEIDANGRPHSRATGGLLTLVLEASKNTKDLASWAVSDTMTKKGSLIYYSNDSLSVEQKVEFSNAYCIKYLPHFKAEGKSPRVLHILISAETLIIDGEEVKNNWPKK